MNRRSLATERARLAPTRWINIAAVLGLASCGFHDDDPSADERQDFGLPPGADAEPLPILPEEAWTTITPETKGILESMDSFEKLTAEGVYVSPGLARMCAFYFQDSVNHEKEIYGPHGHTMITVAMNAPAADAYRSKAKAYPEGAIITKSKDAIDMPSDYRDGVGGMIKRQPGYDPEHGDWEYFYVELASELPERRPLKRRSATGRLANCIDCHSYASGTDYVFGSWSKLSTELDIRLPDRERPPQLPPHS